MKRTLLIAVAAVRTLASQLYGVSTFEPTLLAIVIVPVALASLAACWLPARRAARVNPLTALRAD